MRCLLGTSGSKQWHSSEVLGFSFCPIYPRLGAGETGISKISMCTDKKSSNRKLLCLADRSGRKLGQDRKLLENDCSVTAKHRRRKKKEIVAPSSATPTKVEWEPRLPPLLGYQEAPPLPTHCWYCVREENRELGCHQWRSHGELGLSPPPGINEAPLPDWSVSKEAPQSIRTSVTTQW